MTPVPIYQLLCAIQETVNAKGYNYEITLGFEEYSPCNNPADLWQYLRQSYPLVRADQLALQPCSEKEFWTILDECFVFPGELSKGYGFNAGTVEKIQPLVSAYQQAISFYLTGTSQFYHCAWLKGIPGYPVWWDYCFAIDTGNARFLFIYGSASD
ncbi:MAG: hypothetical protein ACTHMV_01150 [Chitinophagaceae bacterium]